MKYWIEVTHGDSGWTRKLDKNPELRRGLWAPATTRHKNMLMHLKTGDIVLTYLTSNSTRTKKWKTSIVGVSIVEEDLFVVEKKISVKLNNNLELPIPIKFSEYKNNQLLSPEFKNAISYCFQRYLINISPSDFSSLLHIHEDNYIFLNGTIYSSYLSN